MKIRNISKHPQDEIIAEAVKTLQEGGLLVFPTETTYGLGADATNPEAVEKLLAYKTKRSDKPLSIAVCDQAMAEKYVELNATAVSVYKRFLPGPVTVISQGKHQVAPGVESPTGTLGIRWPKYDLLLEIIRQFGKPITATSANASGEKRPYVLSDIFENTSQKQQDLITLALDADRLPPNEPSTVIDTTLDDVHVLRSGSLELGSEESWSSNSPQETFELGTLLAQRYKSRYGYKPVVFALIGEMGAGKTQLTKGLAAGLGITEMITSPTYTLLQEYEFMSEGQKLPFIHIDAWRMENGANIQQLGIQEYLQKNAVLSIEWPRQGLELGLPIIWIEITYGASESERRLTLRESK